MDKYRISFSMDIRLPLLTSPKLTLTKEKLNRKRSSQCVTLQRAYKDGFIVN